MGAPWLVSVFMVFIGWLLVIPADFPRDGDEDGEKENEDGGIDGDHRASREGHAHDADAKDDETGEREERNREDKGVKEAVSEAHGK